MAFSPINTSREIAALYDFMSTPNPPIEPQPTIVFGRQDPLLADVYCGLAARGLITTSVLSGGVGKDSGAILQEGYHSEAAWLSDVILREARARGINLPSFVLEEASTNGGDNARLSLKKLGLPKPPATSLTAVVHATSARRLAETLRFEADNKRAPGAANTTVYTVPTNYAFDPENPRDRREVLEEFMRLVQWPIDGLLHQQDLPQNLVDFAVAQKIHAPRKPSAATGALLRIIPPRARIRLLSRRP